MYMNQTPDIRKSSLYTKLAQATGHAPSWNFWKYLIDQDGAVIGAYAHSTPPNEMVNDITKLIRQNRRPSNEL